MTEMTMVEAVRTALARAMSEDDTVLVLGEDVGVDGGVFRATDGLLARFGERRVIDTPISEALLAGLAVGLGAQGMRPVIEIQFMGFAYPALDQVLNHLSRLRNRTRGRMSCPAVIRMPFGAGVHAPEHHSESTEALFAHVPGIRVVVPSSPAAAYGLLLAAIRDPDPIVFLEPTRLYRALREDVADDGAAAPLDRCVVLRPGRDITIATWGATAQDAIAAARALAADGVDVEVIDVATLAPFDAGTVVESVVRTGRCLVAHEAVRTAGFGAEVAARVADAALLHLVAPVRRVTGYDTIVPLARLEDSFLPGPDRIRAAALDLMAYG
jgi:2-oxoisovalerate dehydrogenase E1 component beta subunit